MTIDAISFGLGFATGWAVSVLFVIIALRAISDLLDE